MVNVKKVVNIINKRLKKLNCNKRINVSEYGFSKKTYALNLMEGKELIKTIKIIGDGVDTNIEDILYIIDEIVFQIQYNNSDNDSDEMIKNE